MKTDSILAKTLHGLCALLAVLALAALPHAASAAGKIVSDTIPELDIDDDEEDMPVPFEIGRKPVAEAPPLAPGVSVQGLPPKYETFLTPPQAYPVPGVERAPASEDETEDEESSDSE